MDSSNKFALSVLMVSIASAGFASGIKWNTNLQAAEKLAKKTHKMVMIDFYGEH